jgi:C_GCAxxG_C_C family probable redox protein
MIFISKNHANNKEKIQEAKARALALYTRDQFVCSEAVLYTINSTLGNPFPAKIVSLASGFAGGVGRSGRVCGALIGGVMALGLAFGRTEPGESCPKLLPITRELADWFEQRFKSSCCAELMGGSSIGEKGHDGCADMTGETAAKALELIFTYRKMTQPRLLLKRVQQILRSI